MAGPSRLDRLQEQLDHFNSLAGEELRKGEACNDTRLAQYEKRVESVLAQMNQASGEAHESCAVLSSTACISFRLNNFISMYIHDLHGSLKPQYRFEGAVVHLLRHGCLHCFVSAKTRSCWAGGGGF